MAVLNNGVTLESGKYRIIESLGSGGFGITYLATQVSLGRKVAIKEFFMKDFCDRVSDTSHVTAPSESSRQIFNNYKRKFIKEAQMIASLNNPHIVKIHDIFEENGTAYYVMEYLGGGSLQDVVKQSGSLSEKDALKYVKQVASALSYIHAKNILHLDVKPSNILLNDDGEAVLIDFGISKHYTDEGGETSTTPVGISKGYAPMEQYQQGSINRFSPATDIYSLGATLYFLLTGKTPPEAAQIYEDGLERPNGITDGIWLTVKKAMEPKRKDRPQSVNDFLSYFNNDKELKRTNTRQDNKAKQSTKRTIEDEETIRVKSPNDNNTNSKSSYKHINYNTSSKKKHLIIWPIVTTLILLLCLIFIPKGDNQGLFKKEDVILINGMNHISVVFEAVGGSKQYDLTKNFKGEWAYGRIPDWCTIQSGTNYFSLICSENKSSRIRTATISFYNKKQKISIATITITQKANLTDDVKASSISLQPSGYVEANVGDTFYLDYSIIPSEAKNHRVTWTSSNSSVASVSALGTITAKGNGKTNIVAKVDNVSAICVLEVKLKSTSPTTNTNYSSSSNKTTNNTNTSSSSYGYSSSYNSSSPSNNYSTATKSELIISNSELTLTIGEKYTIKAFDYNNYPEFNSDNPKVATVSKTGTITAVGLGSTNIWAKDGFNYKRCLVTVTAGSTNSSTRNSSSSSSSYIRTGYPGDVYINYGEVIQLRVSGETVTRWESDNNKVATVSSTGIAQGMSVGQTNIWGYVNGTPKRFFIHVR